MATNPVTKHLDKIADRLEGKGLLKEAAEVDVISNTVEKLSEEAVLDTGAEETSPAAKEKPEEEEKKG